MERIIYLTITSSLLTIRVTNRMKHLLVRSEKPNITEN